MVGGLGYFLFFGFDTLCLCGHFVGNAFYIRQLFALNLPNTMLIRHRVGVKKCKFSEKKRAKLSTLYQHTVPLPKIVIL